MFLCEFVAPTTLKTHSDTIFISLDRTETVMQNVAFKYWRI